MVAPSGRIILRQTISGETARKNVISVHFGSKGGMAACPRHVCFTPITDIARREWQVRFVPKADIPIADEVQLQTLL